MTPAKIVGMLTHCRILLPMVSPSTGSIRKYVQMCHYSFTRRESWACHAKMMSKARFIAQGDHIFRHRGDTIKYSPKHVKLCRKLGFEPKNMMCYRPTHI